jgi:uncharacterized protein
MLRTLLLFCLVIDAHAAGIDCASAKSSVEKLICSDAALVDMDNTLEDLYEVTAIGSEGNSALKARQRAWMADRDKCTDKACLQRSYERRSRELACASNNMGSSIGSGQCYQLKLLEAESILTPLEQKYMDWVIRRSNNREYAKRIAEVERTAWRQYRDAKCPLFGELNGGSDGWKNAMSASCALDETKIRIEAIKKNLRSK